jgi:hypothetical protein
VKTVTDAKGGDQTVDGLADCASPLTETPEMSRGLDSQLLATGLEDLELAKVAQDSCECLLPSDTLKSLAKNQVRESKALPIKLAVKIIGLLVPQAAQIVDPDRGINDDH